MKVSGSLKLGTKSKVSKTTARKGASKTGRSGLFRVSSEPSHASHDVVAPQSLLALQEVYNADVNNAGTVSLDQRALTALQDLQIQLLGGELKADKLEQIKVFLGKQNVENLPEELQQTHKLIVQRVSIELAKLSSVSSGSSEK